MYIMTDIIIYSLLAITTLLLCSVKDHKEGL